MVPCSRFVSLIRSCYSTTMRFFRDDLSIETSVDWYFTEPDAKWIGLSNVFNSRNWYGGTIDWPLLGEVEGADRPWRDGSGLPVGDLGPYGTADQWDDGAYVADALEETPCPGPPPPLCQVPATTAGFVQHTGGPIMPWNLEGPYIATQDNIDPSVWWTDVVKGPCGNLARSMDLRLTSGPPNFTEVAKCTLIFELPGEAGGDWQVPLSSPVFPGEQISVFS